MKQTRVYDSAVDAIGNTPIIRFHQIGANLKPAIFGKLEACNPGGSIKDRVGPYLVNQAEKEGKLKPGGTIVEATSGNTGVGLAMVAIARGYKMIAVMSNKQSPDKVNTLKALGVEVVVTPSEVEPNDPESYYSVAAKIANETPNSILANQYHNPANPQTHYETTGPEIWEQLAGKLDYFVAGIGTGGTISGCARYLKEKNPKIKVIGVEPVGSILGEYHRTGNIIPGKSYLTEGVGEDIIPDNVHFKYIDEIITITDQDAVDWLHRLSRWEGLFCGSSSGAVVAGAVKAAETLSEGRMLIILPDSGSKYLGKFYNPEWIRWSPCP